MDLRFLIRILNSICICIGETAAANVIGRTRSGSFSSLKSIRLGETYNNNINHFAYLTSGFHSVNDSFLRQKASASRGEDKSFAFLKMVVNAGEITRVRMYAIVCMCVFVYVYMHVMYACMCITRVCVYGMYVLLFVYDLYLTFV